MRHLFLIAVLLIFAGCADSSGESAPLRSQIGKNCMVYFRKDALGMAADLPSSVTTGSLNGVTVMQAGELLEVGDDWVVIGYHGRVFHIPQGAIQMVEFGTYINQGTRLSLPLAPKADDHGHGEHAHPATEQHGNHSHSTPTEHAH